MTKSLADIWAEANPQPEPPKPSAEETRLAALQATVESLRATVEKLSEPKPPRRIVVQRDAEGRIIGADEQ